MVILGPGSELKAVEEACREASRTAEPLNGLNILNGPPVLVVSFILPRLSFAVTTTAFYPDTLTPVGILSFILLPLSFQARLTPHADFLMHGSRSSTWPASRLIACQSTGSDPVVERRSSKDESQSYTASASIAFGIARPFRVRLSPTGDQLYEDPGEFCARRQMVGCGPMIFQAR